MTSRRSFLTGTTFSEKNSRTPTTWLPTRIGEAKADLSPAALAIRRRKKPFSTEISWIQTGFPAASTVPGRPVPEEKLISSDLVRKLSHRWGGVPCQTAD